MRSFQVFPLLALLLSCQPPPPDTTASSGPAAEVPAVADATVPSADGVPIRYHAEGSGSPALVFVHGWMCDGSFWSNQVSHFAPTHRVVTVDLAGHGRSGADRADWSIQAFARDVQVVVEKLDLRPVILIGHSMSGYVTLEAARLMKDRVIALVPVDTLHDAEERADPDEIKKFLDSMQLDFKGTTLDFVRSMFPAGARPELVERIAARIAAGPPQVGIGAFKSVIAYVPREALAAVKIPIRCIQSEKYPTKVEINRRYAPQFEAVVMPGTGHFPMLEAPDEFNRLLARTLEDLTSRTAGASPDRPGEGG